MDRPTSRSSARPSSGSRVLANPRRTRLGSAPVAPSRVAELPRATP